jgi:uncharacterized membrane protein
MKEHSMHWGAVLAHFAIAGGVVAGTWMLTTAVAPDLAPLTTLVAGVLVSAFGMVREMTVDFKRTKPSFEVMHKYKWIEGLAWVAGGMGMAILNVVN